MKRSINPLWGSYCSIFSFLCFLLFLSFFCWPMYFLSSLDLRLLISPLVSTNLSFTIFITTTISYIVNKYNSTCVFLCRLINKNNNLTHPKSLKYLTRKCYNLMACVARLRQLFVGGTMSYLRYICLFAHCGLQHILCCVFDLFFSFVLCTICCQFLWIM